MSPLRVRGSVSAVFTSTLKLDFEVAREKKGIDCYFIMVPLRNRSRKQVFKYGAPEPSKTSLNPRSPKALSPNGGSQLTVSCGCSGFSFFFFFGGGGRGGLGILDSGFRVVFCLGGGGRGGSLFVFCFMFFFFFFVGGGGG